jgi:hypothetical protein
MEVTMKLQERRQHRSGDRAEALVLLLEACRERAGLAALVLSDKDGRVVSSSTREGVDAEVIAAHLPRTYLRERVPSLVARTLKLGSTRLFLGAVGAACDAVANEMLHALHGAQRILS